MVRRPASAASEAPNLHTNTLPHPPAGPALAGDGRDRTRQARTALSAAMAGILLFLAVNIVLQLAPPHYSAVSQAVSDLAVGPYGWVMDVAFALSGLSILAFVAGARLATSPETRSRVGFAFLSIWGAAALAIAIAHPDVVDAHGYLGTRRAFDASPSTHGKVHLIVAAVVFLSMALGLVASSRRLGREPRLASLQRPARRMAATVIAGLILTDPLGTRGGYGLMERGVSLVGFGWLLMVAWRLRQPSGAPEAGESAATPVPVDGVQDPTPSLFCSYKL